MCEFVSNPKSSAALCLLRLACVKLSLTSLVPPFRKGIKRKKTEYFSKYSVLNTEGICIKLKRLCHTEKTKTSPTDTYSKAQQDPVPPPSAMLGA